MPRILYNGQHCVGAVTMLLLDLSTPRPTLGWPARHPSVISYMKMCPLCSRSAASGLFSAGTGSGHSDRGLVPVQTDRSNRGASGDLSAVGAGSVRMSGGSDNCPPNS